MLHGSNYENWKLCVQNYLIRQGLWCIVDGTDSQPQIPSQQADDECFKTWMLKNSMALQVIKLSCGTEMLSHITNEDSAKAAWERLATANSNLVQPANDTSGNPAITEQIDEEENNYTLHVALYKALDKNDWKSAKLHLDDHPNAVSARITSSGDTALHIAANSGRVHLVKKLVELMPKEALEIKSHTGFTALSLTAIEGSAKIAKLMVEKNSNLLRIQNRFNLIPLVVSAINGNEDLMRYLYSVTPKEELDPKAGKNGVIFLTSAVEADIYDVALDVLQLYPQLATAQDSDGMTIISALARKPSAFPSGNRHGFLQQFIYTSIPVELDNLYRDVIERSQHNIQIGSEPNVEKFIKVREYGRVWNALARLVPGVKQIYEKKVIHVQALELLKVICPQISNLNVQQLKNAGVYDAIFYTASFGIIEYFKELITSSPHLIYSIENNKGGIGLFEEAVLSRQHNIYNFISQMGVKNDLASGTSNIGNNLLHFAGFLAPPSQLERVSGAALQMQREIQWFLEVEKLVQPKFREAMNGDGKKPRDVFREEHKELVKEGEAWLKETSQACMVVSTLIATVMFAAVFTVPGGNNGETGTPIFSKQGHSILLKSLPQKLILGFASLFVSIATMMTAFGATLVIVLNSTVTWVYIPVTLLASIPVLLFGLLQFPLFVDIVLSTYGPGIFLKKKYKNKED
ncbi:hypothetical protein MKW92_023888 [Papaver armeniacum]|nr:hypothetical protein MKW92_023888 [Papaver armeniacum]